MVKLDLEGLDVVGVWEANPPAAPWRPLVPVLARHEAPDLVLWPVRTDARRGVALGHEEPRASLDVAIEEGRATPVDRPLRARRHHELVRSADGTFAVVSVDMAVRSRLFEVKARLDRALALVEGAADIADIADAFDGAFLVHRFDLVATTLRAGAAARLRDRDPAWLSQCIDDLAHAVEIGADLVEVRAKPIWRELAHAPLRATLYRGAREALDDYLEPKTELDPPVDVDTQAAAVATAIWRQHNTGTSRLPVPHQT